MWGKFKQIKIENPEFRRFTQLIPDSQYSERRDKLASLQDKLLEDKR